MPPVEGVQEGLSSWQQLAGAAAIFLTTAAGVLTRFIAKKGEPETAGAGGKHVVLEQATLSDAGPFLAMARETARTANACDELVRVVTSFIRDTEEQREEREKRDLETELEKVKRENERMQRLLDDARRDAGPFTTARRPKNLMDEQ